MVSLETPTERAFQAESNPFGWLREDLNWTFVEKALCTSSTFETRIVWIIFFIELVVISLASYGLWYLLKSDRAVSIFVLNLFITDIIQICVKPALNYCAENIGILCVFYMYIISILANIGFMVCISLERYVMIKYPVWYRLHHSFGHSAPVCLLVWVISCGLIGGDLILIFNGYLEYAFLISVFIFLMPYPVVVLSFVGSWRALSHSVSVSPDEQKRILRILALVLFIYTVLFLPSIVKNIIFALSIAQGQLARHFNYLHTVSEIMMYLNPLADCLLYVFLRKDVTNMLRCLCCKA